MCNKYEQGHKPKRDVCMTNNNRLIRNIDQIGPLGKPDHTVVELNMEHRIPPYRMVPNYGRADMDQLLNDAQVSQCNEESAFQNMSNPEDFICLSVEKNIPPKSIRDELAPFSNGTNLPYKPR